MWGSYKRKGATKDVAGRRERGDASFELQLLNPGRRERWRVGVGRALVKAGGK